MRVIQSRTSAAPARPLRVVSILRGRWDEQRWPALQALADLGHEVVYVDEILPREGYRKLLQRFRFDVAVLWGSSLQNFLMSDSEPFLLEELQIPYVSLWTDNPLKHLFLLKDVKTPLHRGLFVADTRVIEQLEELGFDNVFYLPPWHIDPEIFRPVAPDPAIVCAVSFAATVNPYAAERQKWRAFWDYRMNAAADAVMAEVRRRRDHVDAWDALSGDWDAWSLEFSLISHAMYFEQKAVVREMVIEAMAGRPLSITGIGSATNLPANVAMHTGRAWNDLSSVFASSTVNLNCTPWPRSCHHRVFQTTACRALSVTDWREDAVALYEPDREVVYYKSLDELGAIVDRYVADSAATRRIAKAGHRRFLAHHTAAHRMAEFSRVLRDLV